MFARLRQIPSLWLVLVHLLLLILAPFFDDGTSRHALIWMINAVALVLVALIIKRKTNYNKIGLVLVILALVFSATVAFSSYSALTPYANIVEAMAYFYAAGGILVYMFNDDLLTLDELFAAAGVFTLLTWGFAFLYAACQWWVPESFQSAAGQPPKTWLELLFLSFSIQSGTGLSDIVPTAPAIRVLVSLQMFAAVMYLTIVVSRLISLKYHPSNLPRPKG